MAVVIENGCVGCPPEMGCLGSACPHKEEKHYFCDGKNCKEEFKPSELYHYHGEIFCASCLLEQFEKVGI